MLFFYSFSLKHPLPHIPSHLQYTICFNSTTRLYLQPCTLLNSTFSSNILRKGKKKKQHIGSYTINFYVFLTFQAQIP